MASNDLVNPDLTALVDTLPAAQRFSYTFEGNAQLLDHILINPALGQRFRRFADGRVNADFPAAWRTDFNRTERVSDHDPAVAYFSLLPPIGRRRGYRFRRFGTNASGTKPTAVPVSATLCRQRGVIFRG